MRRDIVPNSGQRRRTHSMTSLRSAILSQYRLVLRPGTYLRAYDAPQDGNVHQQKRALAFHSKISLGDQLCWDDLVALRKLVVNDTTSSTDDQDLSTAEISCPICLEQPRAAMSGQCGHTFCGWCILRHIGANSHAIGNLNALEILVGERAASAPCPVCAFEIAIHELKPVLIERWHVPEHSTEVVTDSMTQSDSSSVHAHGSENTRRFKPTATEFTPKTLEHPKHGSSQDDNVKPKSRLRNAEVGATFGSGTCLAAILAHIRAQNPGACSTSASPVVPSSTEDGSPEVTSTALVLSIDGNSRGFHAKGGRPVPPHKQGIGRKDHRASQSQNGLPASVRADGMESCILPSKPFVMQFVRIDRPAGCFAAQSTAHTPIDTAAYASSNVPPNVVHAGTAFVPAHHPDAAFNALQAASAEFLKMLHSRHRDEIMAFARECASDEQDATFELLQMSKFDVSPQFTTLQMERFSGLAAAAGSWRPYVEIMIRTIQLRETFLRDSLLASKAENPFYHLSERKLSESSSKISTAHSDSSNESFAFMQSACGEFAFLHPLSTKLLFECCHSYDAFPQRLSARVIAVEAGRLTNAMRRKLPFLSHLPSSSPIWLCELDLRSHLPRHVARDAGISDVLRRRNKVRQQLLSQYKRRQDIEMQREQEKMARHLAAAQHMSRTQLFAKYMGSSMADANAADNALLMQSRSSTTLKDAFSTKLADRPEALARANSSRSSEPTSSPLLAASAHEPLDSTTNGAVETIDDAHSSASSYEGSQRAYSSHRKQSPHLVASGPNAWAPKNNVANRAAAGWTMAKVAGGTVGGGYFPSLRSSKDTRSNSNESEDVATISLGESATANATSTATKSHGPSWSGLLARNHASQVSHRSSMASNHRSNQNALNDSVKEASSRQYVQTAWTGFAFDSAHDKTKEQHTTGARQVSMHVHDSKYQSNINNENSSTKPTLNSRTHSNNTLRDVSTNQTDHLTANTVIRKPKFGKKKITLLSTGGQRKHV